jgi:Mrp family chromosome partitioning ATPase
MSLARSAAVAGLSVVIVDCDLRRPVLHKMLDLKNEVGLVDLLAQTAEETSVIQADRKSNCSVITSGKMGTIPTEWLLNPGRIKDTLRKLESSYELVILNAPPVGVSAEPLIFMRDIDMVLFAVRTGTAKPETVRANIRQLRRGSEADLYTVMTFAPTRGTRADPLS